MHRIDWKPPPYSQRAERTSSCRPFKTMRDYGMRHRNPASAIGLGTLLAMAMGISCSATGARNDGDAAKPGAGSTGAGGGQGGSGLAGLGGNIFGGNDACAGPFCSTDKTQVIACDNTILETCTNRTACAQGACVNACDAARATKSSVGCEYYAVYTDAQQWGPEACFVAFVANTSADPAHLEVTFEGASLDVGAFAKIPQGAGSALTYGAFDAAAGLQAGEVAILFLTGDPDSEVPCPVPAAVPAAQVSGTSRGEAFRITADVPVVAYQMLPYGGGSAAITGATLLLPTSAWDLNYIGVNAYASSDVAFTNTGMALVAAEDDTTITILPKVALVGGTGVVGSAANDPVSYTMFAGQVLQISQPEELTGSPIQSDKPIGLWAAHPCLNVPLDAAYCDHAEQQIPPVRAMGNRYAAVSYRQRSSVPESPIWRVIGAVDGTELTYDPPTAGPATLNLGDAAEFTSTQPFVVSSQDTEHPFLLVTYMSGSTTVVEGYGDADFVRITAADQYLSRYVFFTDPTYPETNLVVVRRKGKSGFSDVTLDCAGVLTDWTPIGASGDFEYTRTDLVRHNFEPQGSCNNGRREMTSEGPFGLWVWGWGTPETSEGICFSELGTFTCNVSYGYPAGENVVPINDVVVPPVPD